MGVDTVELVMRTEEVFGITLPDSDCKQVRTVGDFYHLVLGKLDLPDEKSPVAIEQQGLGASRFTPPIRRLFHRAVEHPIAPDPAITPWTSPDVWFTLKSIIQDQLQIDPADISERATFIDDLRCD